MKCACAVGLGGLLTLNIPSAGPGPALAQPAASRAARCQSNFIIVIMPNPPRRAGRGRRGGPREDRAGRATGYPAQRADPPAQQLGPAAKRGEPRTFVTGWHPAGRGGAPARIIDPHY